MKFTILTYGTDGDTRPLAALAKELIGQGHEAHLLADVSAAPLAAQHGIPFTALAGNMQEALTQGGALAGVMRDGGDVSRITRACAQIAQRNTTEWMATTRELASGSDVLVFSGLASYAGLAVAEGLDMPCVGAGLWPMTPTRDHAAAFMRPRALPGWANRFTHQFFGALSWAMFRPAVNKGRSYVFGKAPRRAMWQGYPVLYGCSRVLLPRPNDWPANVDVTGAWHLAPTQAWEPPLALQAFLDAGEAPIYVGFGSMTGFDRNKLLAWLVEAVGGRRALFYPGWSGIDVSGLPSNFYVLGDTPHDWLFPRTSLIVHHGGAGTSHAAARSGVPSVVVPFAGDQFFWADRLAKAGIATWRPAARLDGGALGELMAGAMAPAMRQKARMVADAMRHEDGNRYAVERMLNGAAQRLA
ncbi:MAG TPA: glycosyltransferase [Telluria sp.]|nr:glycosyltransferase [Telluria sp.]